MAILQRKRCQTLFVWLILIIGFSQLLMFLLLKEVESSVPRYKGLSNNLNILKLPNNRLKERQVVRGPFDKIIRKKIETKSIVDTPGDLTSSRNKIYISRKLEKLKNLKETEQKQSVTIRRPVKKAPVPVKITFDSSNVGIDARATGPDDVLISVKTTKQYHYTRLEEIRQTWWSLAKRGVSIIFYAYFNIS